jgi:hypothetical protein
MPSQLSPRSSSTDPAQESNTQQISETPLSVSGLSASSRTAPRVKLLKLGRPGQRILVRYVKLFVTGLSPLCHIPVCLAPRGGKRPSDRGRIRRNRTRDVDSAQRSARIPGDGGERFRCAVRKTKKKTQGIKLPLRRSRNESGSRRDGAPNVADVNSRAVGGRSTKHSGSTRSTTGSARTAIDNDGPGSASR